MILLDLYNYSEKEQKQLLKSIVMIVDKREQMNVHIVSGFEKMKVKYINKSLEWGDYSFYLPRNEELGINRDIFFNNKIAIERKNGLNELSNNISNERTRFENELIKSQKGKFILMIEDTSYKSILEGRYNTLLSSKAFFSSLMTFKARYNIEIDFIDREIVSKYIYSTFYYYLRELVK